MINVNSLNQAINALKAETQRDAITPIYLGNLLQRISDLIATATTESDIAAITQLQIAVNNLKQKVNAYVINLQNDPTYISHIVQGDADRNNVYLNATKVNVAYGTASTVEQAVTIKQATESRAGVMRAQQVTDLNEAKAGVQALQTSVSRLQSEISDLMAAVENISASATRQYHIECKANQQDGLHVIGADALVAMGYVPYIFRYSRKKNRYRFRRGERRRKGPKMRGWHVFCGEGKIAFDGADLIKIAHHSTEGITPSSYSPYPERLFSGKNVKYDAEGEIRHIYLGYGCDSVDVINGKRFRFAVAFGRPQSGSRFDFSKLVTNLAEFGVYVYRPEESGSTSIAYVFSR